ncbi:hypothetical protein XM38_034730 [Halomicronema hongdechloris C2206]|uniref:Uncharacterized protein n=1 Tax=Halomicronema hongdechloris C2206 TaxID=1641165 RepID=A0A1Z3HQE9_9CYAN|nr:hypothetical protein XM38_034730 [Halomicronema hongdechloris C2206]
MLAHVDAAKISYRRKFFFALKRVNFYESRNKFCLIHLFANLKFLLKINFRSLLSQTVIQKSLSSSIQACWHQ